MGWGVNKWITKKERKSLNFRCSYNAGFTPHIHACVCTKPQVQPSQPACYVSLLLYFNSKIKGKETYLLYCLLRLLAVQRGIFVFTALMQWCAPVSKDVITQWRVLFSNCGLFLRIKYHPICLHICFLSLNLSLLWEFFINLIFTYIICKVVFR